MQTKKEAFCMVIIIALTHVQQTCTGKTCAKQHDIRASLLCICVMDRPISYARETNGLVQNDANKVGRVRAGA